MYLTAERRWVKCQGSRGAGVTLRSAISKMMGLIGIRGLAPRPARRTASAPTCVLSGPPVYRSIPESASEEAVPLVQR